MHTFIRDVEKQALYWREYDGQGRELRKAAERAPKGAAVGGLRVPAPCGAEPVRPGYRVGAHTVRRVCHGGRYDLDVSRRGVGSFFFQLLLPHFNLFVAE
jgi:hypothetical protein